MKIANNLQFHLFLENSYTDHLATILNTLKGDVNNNDHLLTI